MQNQREFVSEVFHVLAQPLTTLRMTVDLALRKPLETGARAALEECEVALNQVMSDLAMLREISELEGTHAATSCSLTSLLQSAIAEMQPVAESSGVGIQAVYGFQSIVCNPELFERGIFLLLDSAIASAGDRALRIHVHEYTCVQMTVTPAPAASSRLRVCQQTMLAAGAKSFQVDRALDSVVISFDRAQESIDKEAINFTS